MTDSIILAKRFRKQARACATLGSDLYAFLLERAADDIEAGGPTWRVMKPYVDATSGSAVALKLMGAVHRLVLEGKAPGLAFFFPSVGGTGPITEAWDPFIALLEHEEEAVRTDTARPVQTNEVGRSAALLGGFLEVAHRTGMPLRILEVGASAGLNLRWDHYRYEADDGSWGDPLSPVKLSGYVTAPPFDRDATIAARAGCDPNPIDAATEEGRLTLSSYVWPDQHWRWEQMRGALDIAREVPVSVHHELASDFLERELAELPDGVATVVYHSIVIQYMEPGERQRVIDAIADTGGRATTRAPFAWLRMEPPARHFRWAADDWEHWATLFPDPPAGPEFENLGLVHLNLWPGGDTELIARAGYHGRPIHWL